MIRLTSLVIERQDGYLAGHATFADSGLRGPNALLGTRMVNLWPPREVRILWCCERQPASAPGVHVEIWPAESTPPPEVVLPARDWCEAMGEDITRLLLDALDQRGLLTGVMRHGR